MKTCQANAKKSISSKRTDFYERQPIKTSTLWHLQLKWTIKQRQHKVRSSTTLWIPVLNLHLLPGTFHGWQWSGLRCWWTTLKYNVGPIFKFVLVFSKVPDIRNMSSHLAIPENQGAKIVIQINSFLSSPPTWCLNLNHFASLRIASAVYIAQGVLIEVSFYINIFYC